MKRVSIMIAALVATILSGAAGAAQIYSGSQCSSFGGWDSWANLQVEKPAGVNTCTTAWTADQGIVYSDGSNWIAPAFSSVASVAMSAPAGFSVAGSPVGPGTGTLALSYAAGQAANRFLATPNGTTGAMGLRLMVAADIPSPLTSNTSGNAATATALAAAPTQCTGTNFATGITTAGNANCSTPAAVAPPIGTPNARSLTLATAFQATDNSRAAMVTVNLTSTATLSLSGGTSNSATVVIGATSAVASGTGTVIANYSNTNTGALTIGLNLSTVSAVPVTFALPKSWFFAVLQTAGTVSITSSFDQAIG